MTDPDEKRSWRHDYDEEEPSLAALIVALAILAVIFGFGAIGAGRVMGWLL